MTIETYVGSELELFRNAHNWKSYMRRSLSPHIGGSVAEVGAGIGGTTESLSTIDGITDWLCIEPDSAQAAKIDELIRNGTLPDICSTQMGILSDISVHNTFDTIIYVDVLEHIDDDRGELLHAAKLVNPGGKLVVLGPAYQYLFSPFDKAVGHYRRYTIDVLRGIAPPGLKEHKAFYLDSVGLIMSLINKLFLRQDLPTLSQIRTWDRFIVPVAQVVDPLILRSFGRSAVIVWQKPW
jgi:SAM-dependent methyltransferase